ncbi:DUF1616 domain-containing protein [Methanosarcina sp. MSH10X1]|uniref:DUF1616 domain-containing protein n=1 Tax=Methanosarcina sp. MSH10X1 TaxID=2507075 RepID=UPI000FFB9ED7|nr:DUF1616 domain-containing protein [Methanosarcina sp. MSH10X1]RXA21940.1 DUF1616 domain-containing protein [Methanosarcina sp. MSH10X1]
MSRVRKFPLDLMLVAGLVLLTDIFLIVPVLSGNFLCTILGIPMMLFLPGYALIAAFFPAKNDLDAIERTALSFGMSAAVIPLTGIVWNYSRWGVSFLPVLVSLSIFTFAMCGLSYLRRGKLPENEAFEVSFRAMALQFKAEFLEKSESRLDKTFTVFLILSILLSTTVLVYAIIGPKEGEHFTEFYILGPEGEADNYTTNFTLEQSGTVIVGVVNNEYRPMNYTMELKLENKSLPLPESLQKISLAHNETLEEPLEFVLPFRGRNMKLEFLLFNETEKTIPYRDLHIWIDVMKEV